MYLDKWVMWLKGVQLAAMTTPPVHIRKLRPGELPKLLECRAAPGTSARLHGRARLQTGFLGKLMILDARRNSVIHISSLQSQARISGPTQ